MHGAGVGYDVSKATVNQLPRVSPSPTAMWGSPPGIDPAHTVIFEDSKEGWAKGLLEALNNSWYGREVKLDVSKIRPEGAPLNTFGGRASGPQPLMKATKFCLNIVHITISRKKLSK